MGAIFMKLGRAPATKRYFVEDIERGTRDFSRLPGPIGDQWPLKSAAAVRNNIAKSPKTLCVRTYSSAKSNFAGRTRSVYSASGSRLPARISSSWRRSEEHTSELQSL